MTVALDIITDALQMLGVYDPGQPISDADAQTALTVLVDMQDSWSNEGLTCYTILEQSAVLVPGKQSYTIGPGGDFNMTRPIRLIEGPGSAYIQDANGNNYGMEVVPRNKWNMYGNRSALVTSNFPDVLFYDPKFPLGVINVMPYPNLPYTMFWDSYLQLVDAAALNSAIALPPGYIDALKSNLACYLKPYFADAQLDPLIIARAARSLGNIKRSNMRPLVALYESAIVSRAGLSFNIYTDRQGSSTGSS
jgi:hypothetical protein